MRYVGDVAYGWPARAAQLVVLQRHLGAQALAIAASDPWTFQGDPTIAGCFITFERGGSGPGHAGDRSWAAAVSYRAGVTLEHAVAEGRVPAAYAPGLLAAREGPALESVVAGLRVRPDVLLVNATALDHPRQAGLAVHLGAVLNLPTVGVTHRPLLADGPMPAEMSRGARAPLHLDRRLVGYWVCTRAGARPIVAHAGWRTDPEIAAQIVLATTSVRSRTPEPLRQARRYARTARASGTR